MVSLDVGRVCMKVVGRESGMYCVVLKNINKSFIEITGPKLLTGIKRRRVNINHVEPTKYKLELKEGADENEVLAAFEKARLVKKFNLKKPSAADMKSEKEKEAKKEIKEKVEPEKKTEAVKKEKKPKEKSK